MKSTTVLCLAIAAAAFAGPANAIFKCTTSKGIVYQDRPCREGNETDVRIVVPTGELAPKAELTTENGAPTNTARSEERTQSVKPARSGGDASTTAAKPAEGKARDGAVTEEGSRRKDPSSSSDRSTPMTADQARKTESGAKYYSTEGFGSGSDTPAQMNCESPSGEKRTFYFSNGKLTSI